MSYFVIVRGPLGAGKTTVAGALAGAVGAEVIAVDEILESWTWDGGSEALFLRANDVVAERALPILTRGQPVVVDGNFYWASAIEDLLARLPFPHAVFSLDVPLAACIERDRRRPLSYGEEAVRAVFEKVRPVVWEETVDGSGSVDETVRAIRSHLPPGRSAAASPPPDRTPRAAIRGTPDDDPSGPTS